MQKTNNHQNTQHPQQTQPNQNTNNQSFEMDKSSEINLYPEFIRTTGICLIVILHVAAILFYQFDNKFNWIASIVFDAPGRVGVPLFFMLSGALLLTKQEPIHVFFKKRFIKVLIPLIAWSVFYLIWRSLYHKQSVPNWFLAILNGPTYFHLGFIYALIGLYLAAPVLRYFYQAGNFYTKLYFLIFAFYAGSLLPTFMGLTGKPNPIGIDLTFFNGWIGYFVLGAFLAEFSVKQYRFSLLGLFVIGSILTGLLTVWWSNKVNAPNEFFYEYLKPNVVLSALGLFYFFKLSENSLKRLNEKTKKVIITLSKTSFGIYLIHPFILEIFSSGLLVTPLNAQMGNPYITIPAVSILCLAICFGIIYIMQRIPVVKHCVP